MNNNVGFRLPRTASLSLIKHMQTQNYGFKYAGLANACRLDEHPI